MIDIAINIVEAKLARSSWPTRWRHRCQSTFPGARSADAGGPANNKRSRRRSENKAIDEIIGTEIDMATGHKRSTPGKQVFSGYAKEKLLLCCCFIAYILR